MKDIQVFQQKFYGKTEKLYQDSFTMQFCSVNQIQQKRPRNKTHKGKEHTIKCFVKDSNKKLVPACKQTFIGKRVHKLRAKAYFELLREEREGTATFSFDYQKNQLLPKLPDQEAYYSHKIYLFNFTVVQGHSQERLNPPTVTSSCWTENGYPKGSNEVASCTSIYHILDETSFSETQTIKLIVFARVVRLGGDVRDLNWKESMSKVIKRTCAWHFPFAKSKKIVITKNFGQRIQICRRGKEIEGINPSTISKRNVIQDKKISIVAALLKAHYSEGLRSNEDMQFDIFGLDEGQKEDEENLVGAEERFCEYVGERPNNIYRDCSRFDYNSFVTDLLNINWQTIYDLHNIDEIIAIWNSRIIEVLDLHAPYGTVKITKEEAFWWTKPKTDEEA
nr:unnamed protein product [Callosobruchus analis]